MAYLCVLIRFAQVLETIAQARKDHEEWGVGVLGNIDDFRNLMPMDGDAHKAFDQCHWYIDPEVFDVCENSK